MGDCLYSFILTRTTHTPSLGKSYRCLKKLLRLQYTPHTPPWTLGGGKNHVFTPSGGIRLLYNTSGFWSTRYTRPLFGDRLPLSLHSNLNNTYTKSRQNVSVFEEVFTTTVYPESAALGLGRGKHTRHTHIYITTSGGIRLLC